MILFTGLIVRLFFAFRRPPPHLTQGLHLFREGQLRALLVKRYALLLHEDDVRTHCLLWLGELLGVDASQTLHSTVLLLQEGLFTTLALLPRLTIFIFTIILLAILLNQVQAQILILVLVCFTQVRPFFANLAHGLGDLHALATVRQQLPR